MAQQRIWFAEDIAHAMERLEEIRSGIEFRPKALETVSKEFGVEPMSLNAMIHNARKNGFDAYPMREQ